jgi:ferric enterobactin receptor
MRIFILLLFNFCFFGANAQQTPSLQISGKLVDSVIQQPISFATVILKNEKNIQLKSAISTKDGSFLITGVATGSYSLHIVHVGYQTKTIPVKLENTAKVFDQINLTAVANQLKGVTVTGDRPLVKQEIDRIAYDVKADPESKINNVLEMMRKVPLLSVDGDDNIQLQGNSNYKILINGKPSGMMERNPKDILKSMPASSIERIEVITTPPAKYDGEGLAGIINIITFKKADNGTNGTVNVSERFPVGGPGVGGTFTLKSGKFGIATNAGGSLNGTPILNNSNSRITQGTNATNLWQTGTRDVSGKSGYAGVELSYEIDSLNLISGQLNYNASDNKSFVTQFSTLNNANALLQRYELNNTLNGNGDGIDAAFNYQLGAKKDKNRLLTFSYRYYQYSNTQYNGVDIFNTVAYDATDYQQDNTGGSSEQTVQVDYVYPLKKINIEAGVKAIFRDNTSDFQFLTTNNSGGLVIDPLRTNVFDNQQNVYAIYNTYQFNLKNWAVKAGLRAERTEIDANFESGNTALSNNSFNLIPSISLMRKFKDMSSINFGFTSRIQRPGINQLNPFVDRSNPNFESSGNPDLRPMLGNSIEANYSRFKKATLNINARVMLFDNVIMPRVTTDPATNITRSSFGNTGDATLMGLGVNVGYPFSTKLRVNINAMGNYGIVKGEVNGVTLRKSGLMRRAFTSVTYRPSKTLQATASVNYNGPNLSLQGTSNSFVSSSFSVNKDFLNNKLTLSLAANNVFTKYRNAINYIDGPNFTQESFNQNYQRGFTTSLNYRFGRLKESIKKNKKGIDNNDVSGGSL